MIEPGLIDAAIGVMRRRVVDLAGYQACYCAGDFKWLCCLDGRILLLGHEEVFVFESVI